MKTTVVVVVVIATATNLSNKYKDKDPKIKKQTFKEFIILKFITFIKLYRLIYDRYKSSIILLCGVYGT